MHAIFLQDRRFALCYHKDWFHICNSNVWHWPILTDLCICHMPSPNTLSLLYNTGCFTASCEFSASPFMLFLQPRSSCVLSPCLHLHFLGNHFPAFISWSLFLSALFLPPSCCTDSTMLMLRRRYKMIPYLHSSFPLVLFFISLCDLCALGCKHLKEEECFMFSSVKPCANCWEQVKQHGLLL